MLGGVGEWRVRVLESPLAVRLGLVSEGKRKAGSHATLRLDSREFQLVPLADTPQTKKQREKKKEKGSRPDGPAEAAEDTCMYMNPEQLNAFEQLVWPIPLVRR